MTWGTRPDGGIAARAQLTVTFTAPKPAHVFGAREGAIPRWVLVPIGSPAALVDDPRHWLNCLTEDEATFVLRHFQRQGDSHKGNYGHVLTVAGSGGKDGCSLPDSEVGTGGRRRFGDAGNTGSLPPSGCGTDA
jgi:NAD(P)H-hydrate epimerase